MAGLGEAPEEPTCFSSMKKSAGDAYESKPAQSIICIGTTALAVVSIVTAIIAFSSFDAATDNLKGLIGNWERSPITGVYLSNTSTCPSGYSLMNPPKWPGTQSSACACPSSAYSTISEDYEYSSATKYCDANQTDAGCLSQPTFDKIQLNEWRGRYICLRREGEAQLISTRKTRPIPKKAGVCESGYKACGDSTYDKKRTICFPDDYPCPVSGASTGTSLPTDYSDNYTMTTDDGTNWYIRFEYENEMPINHIELVLYNPNEKRGQCFIGGENQEAYQSSGDSYDYKNNYPNKCSRVDTRWETLDYQTESNFLSENFEEEDSCLNDADTSDYVSTGSQCGTTPFTDSDCMMYGWWSTALSDNGCSSSDYVCKNIYYQSQCGGLRRFADKADEYWAVQFRREIYWKSDCDASMVEIKAIENPVDSIQTALLWNLVFNVIGNVLGVVFAIGIYQVKRSGKSGVFACCGSDSAAQLTVLEHMNKRVSLSLCFMKLIPAIIAIAVFSKVSRTIHRGANGDCVDDADKMTLLTFTNLEEEINRSIDSLITQVCFDSLHILAEFCLTVLAHIQHAKEAAKHQQQDQASMEAFEIELAKIEQAEKESTSSGVQSVLSPSHVIDEEVGNPIFSATSVEEIDDPIQKTNMIDVVIPGGLHPGDTFNVSFQNNGEQQTLAVVIPNGLREGDTVRVMSPSVAYHDDDEVIDGNHEHHDVFEVFK